MHLMNDKEKELQFLQIVRVNGNIYHLTLSNWSYHDIVKMYSSFSMKGIVAVHGGQGTFLTQKGNEYIKSLYKEMGIKGIGRFLLPATEHKIAPLSKEVVYVPTTLRAIEDF